MPDRHHERQQQQRKGNTQHGQRAAAFVAKTLDKGFPAIRPVPNVTTASLLRRLKRIELRLKNMRLIS